MWTTENRERYDRSRLRYPSDLTDEEWKLVEPLIPPGKPGGGKRRVVMREVVNGLTQILSTGCQWAALPNTFRPRARCMIISTCGVRTARSTTFITRFTWRVANKPLARPAPPQRSSTARASKALKGASMTRRATSGKGTKGKKRHILVDTQGLLMHAIVHAADIQDRDGGGLVMATLFGMFPFLLKSTPMAAIRDRYSGVR